MKHNELVIAVTGLISMSALGIQSAHAGGVITVDSISDQPISGFITLREAINTANGLSGVEIVFDENLFSSPQTITLKAGEMLISSEVTINGPGADLLTIDGNNQSRIFTVDDGSSTTQAVSISGLTLTNGNGASKVTNERGGCVMSFEQLTITDSQVTGCSARGGGGVWSRFGSLLIENTTINDNYAQNRGGGVYARSAQVSITNTTISGNTANRTSESGGGVNSNGADLEISNSTISNNLIRTGSDNAGGIFIQNGGELSLVNSTVFNNEGVGIEITLVGSKVFKNRGLEINSVSMSNSLIAGHVAGNCNFVGFNETSINQNNLDTDGSCDVEAINHITVTDPMLEPLADFGGSTFTHRPLPGSPVIDKGSDSLCAQFDQRGENRPKDGDGDGSSICDIGAIELSVTEDVPRVVIFKNGFED